MLAAEFSSMIMSVLPFVAIGSRTIAGLSFCVIAGDVEWIVEQRDA